ncbi:MAG: hypothetical protein GY797_10820 [Deltaproteobacteria bacterium]|nr:hypothetical protein [Deltaproteobacteria bacterium]
MTWTMKCEKCGADLGDIENNVASICLRVRGEEETRSYFLCKACDVYSVWICIEDFFTDKDTFFARGPIPREKGDEIIDKIRKCSNPGNVPCGCPTHKEMESFTY